MVKNKKNRRNESSEDDGSILLEVNPLYKENNSKEFEETIQNSTKKTKQKLKIEDVDFFSVVHIKTKSEKAAEKKLREKEERKKKNLEKKKEIEIVESIENKKEQTTHSNNKVKVEPKENQQDETEEIRLSLKNLSVLSQDKKSKKKTRRDHSIEEIKEKKEEQSKKTNMIYQKKKKKKVEDSKKSIEEERIEESENDSIVSDWEHLSSSESEGEHKQNQTNTEETNKYTSSHVETQVYCEIQEKEPNLTENEYRSPICCVLGHVDTGKTKILDNIRSSNVQDGEVGGITQQIGATFIPTHILEKKTSIINKQGKLELKVPGLLVIDTPGHESFSNLRLRGSSLCDIAILVVDIQHGLEPQTIESLNMLKKKKTPFLVALNKIDVCYEWNPIPHSGFRASLKAQKPHTRQHFHDLASKVILQFSEQGFNSSLYYESKDLKKTVSLVPTSAKSGEGIPDLLGLIVQITQRWMAKRISFRSDVECIGPLKKSLCVSS